MPKGISCIMKTMPVLFILLLLMPSLCYAYVGPGVGLTVISSLLALGSAFFITLFGFIWLPIKRFFKGAENDTTDSDENEDASQQEKTPDDNSSDNDVGNNKNGVRPE